MRRRIAAKRNGESLASPGNTSGARMELGTHQEVLARVDRTQECAGVAGTEPECAPMAWSREWL